MTRGVSTRNDRTIDLCFLQQGFDQLSQTRANFGVFVTLRPMCKSGLPLAYNQWAFSVCDNTRHVLMRLSQDIFGIFQQIAGVDWDPRETHSLCIFDLF